MQRSTRKGYHYKTYGLLDDIGQTLEAIGAEYNVTNERIRQIEAKVFRKIRARYTNRLKTYYDE